MFYGETNVIFGINRVELVGAEGEMRWKKIMVIGK